MAVELFPRDGGVMNPKSTTGTPDWVKTIYKADAVIGGVVVLLEVLAFYLLLKKKNTKVDVVK